MSQRRIEDFSKRVVKCVTVNSALKQLPEMAVKWIFLLYLGLVYGINKGKNDLRLLRLEGLFTQLGIALLQ